MSQVNCDVIDRVQNSFKHDRTIIINKSIGKGAFGQCFEVTLSWNTSVTNRQSCCKALKFIPGEIYRSKKELFDQEILTHKQLSNQYIVQLHQVNIDPSYNDVHMIMELCENGSLGDYIVRYGAMISLTPDQMNRVSSGICKGLRYLQEAHKIVHRDIKPANILLNHKMYPKISDFGLATTLQKCRANSSKICGTPHYLAPEIFQQKGHSFESDVWALGVTLFHMISGFTPFEENAATTPTRKADKSGPQQQQNSLQYTISRVYRNVIAGRYKFPKGTPDSARNYIKGILQREPELRPNINQLLQMKFCDITSGCPETPDEDRRVMRASSEIRVSLDSFVFISDQPVLDAIETLSNRVMMQVNNRTRSGMELVWVNRWGMSSVQQIYYTLNNGAYGGNLRGVKGILLKDTLDNSKQHETHFQNNDVTLTSSLADQIDCLTREKVNKFCSVIFDLLQKFDIPKAVLESYYSTIFANTRQIEHQTHQSNSNNNNREIFVYKWAFHADSVIFLFSNGVWQIGLKDHTKLIVYSKWALLFNYPLSHFEIIGIDDWCRRNIERLDIIRTLLYSIL